MDTRARTIKRPSDDQSVRTGLSEQSIRRAFLDNLLYVQARFIEAASTDDQYRALAHTIRDRLIHRWVNTIRTYQKSIRAQSATFRLNTFPVLSSPTIC